MPAPPTPPAPRPDAEAVSQANEIVRRLVSEAQHNVDEILQMIVSPEEAPPEPLAPQAYQAFSRRWSGLAEVLVDPRTGLSSRILFWDRLSQAAIRHRRHRTRFAVLYVDCGDADERHVPHLAARLGAGLRGTDTIAYAGSGEFTILLDQLQADADALAVADRVREAMARAAVSTPDPARIGIAVFAGGGADPGTLLWDAYAAMRQARGGGVVVAAPRPAPPADPATLPRETSR